MNAFSWYVWGAVILGQGALATWMVVRGSWRQWPSLFSFLFILCVRDVIRVAASTLWPSPGIEFYTYWWASLVAECLEVWMIVQIGLELAGVFPWLRRVIANGLPALAALTLVVCSALSLRSPLPSYARLGYVVMHLDYLVSFTVLATFLAGVCLPSGILALQWSGGVRGIAAGFALEVTASHCASWLSLSNSTINPSLLYQVKSGLFLVSLVVWGVSTGRTKKAAIYTRALLGAEGQDNK